MTAYWSLSHHDLIIICKLASEKPQNKTKQSKKKERIYIKICKKKSKTEIEKAPKKSKKDQIPETKKKKKKKPIKRQNVRRIIQFPSKKKSQHDDCKNSNQLSWVANMAKFVFLLALGKLKTTDEIIEMVFTWNSLAKM
jgi:hypothetical protein